VEHVAEGQEKNWGTPQGILEEVTGSYKNFTISELGDRGGCHQIITVLTPLREPGRSSPSSGYAPGSVA
jgi:hypothetical protein